MLYAIYLGTNLGFFYYPAWAQLAGSKFSRRIYLMQYQALSKSKHVELHTNNVILFPEKNRFWRRAALPAGFLGDEVP